MRAKAMLVGGTASHAGKSWMTTAICRWLRRRGVRVAPFKAQNMSNNSYPCRDGGEIGRAQVAQAEACGLEPSPDMNPILLKPTSNMGSQVVVDGQVWRNLSARAYYDHFDFLLERVLAAFDRLSSRFDYVVMEGAGSVTELNLKERDLVNLGLARRLNSPVLLIADIDRGGVFASLVGTYHLLEEDERKLVRSFAVNRFRGDVSLFQDAVGILERWCQSPCLGVFPMVEDFTVDSEDAVDLDEARQRPGEGSRVAIVRLPHISNFTDFKLLPDACWISRPVDHRFEVVMLPGTKSTIEDLAWMRRAGLDEWVLRQHREGAAVIGVCGGYQMMGEAVEDPDAVESGRRSAAGLGLLPVRTVMQSAKTTRVVQAATPSGLRFSAYEIHMGATGRPAGSPPFAWLPDGSAEGIRHGRCTGTYLHGALENAAVLSEILGHAVAPAAPKELAYDRLADWFERHADVKRFQELYL